MFMHGDDSILKQKHGKMIILSIPQSLHLWFVNLRRPDVFSWVEKGMGVVRLIYTSCVLYRPVMTCRWIDYSYLKYLSCVNFCV